MNLYVDLQGEIKDHYWKRITAACLCSSRCSK